jgi:DNA-binding transcriptional LysR family regulator
MRNRMELRRLRYFLRIAAEGSLGKASRALGIAQPALGRQIQLLEDELGVKLFERVPKGMRLTDEGEYLRDALEHPLQRIDIALRNVRSYSTRVEAALTLGLPPVIAQFLGPRLVGRLQRELPNLRLRIAEGDSGRLAEELARGLVDIAMLVGVAPDNKVFHAEVLKEQLSLVGPPDCPLAGREAVSFAELQELPLILPGTEAGLRTGLTKAAAAANVKIEPVLEIDSIELAKQAVKTGAGYTILPPLAFRSEAGRGELIGFPIVDPELDQGVLWAVQPHWRVPRSTYNQVERVVYEEWFAAVSSGEWPARWELDLSRLSLPIRRNQRASVNAANAGSA